MCNTNIGRNGMWGNPIVKDKPCPVCSTELVPVYHRKDGSTLECYKKYLFARMKGNAKAMKIAKDAGLPSSSMSGAEFSALLKGLDTSSLWCPGCSPKGKHSTCHATVLGKAVAYLNK